MNYIDQIFTFLNIQFLRGCVDATRVAIIEGIFVGDFIMFPPTDQVHLGGQFLSADFKHILDHHYVDRTAVISRPV